MTRSIIPPMSDKPPVEFRKDGWPLCPVCGEDEVISHLNAIYIFQYEQKYGIKPPIDDYLIAGITCLYCGWRWEKSR